MTENDAAWMARKIAAISGPQLESIVDEARFSKPQDSQYVLETLLARRQAVLRAWLPAGSEALEPGSDTGAAQPSAASQPSSP